MLSNLGQIKIDLKKIHASLRGMNFGRALKETEALMAELDETPLEFVSLNIHEINRAQQAIEAKVDQEIDAERKRMAASWNRKLEERVAEEIAKTTS
jgi:DNA-binding transcriptional MerR regulator